MRPPVVPAVLDTDQSCLGPTEIAPLLRLLDHVTVLHDTPEEVVRRQEHQVPAQVAVALDRVVLACRRVLVVAREDHQPIRLGKRGARRALEVGVREEVDPMAVPGKPVQEREVVPPEVERHTAVQERSVEPDREM